ncbi:unnamed protein product [Mytilus coruscus]|uniref:Uncharacterized protein n=1 Tax=Mytilus coruscus TaxID=42192 RepID=A0A6J8F133_MYTCO|nr:unnamed protein product [Mytilus coruscus]
MEINLTRVNAAALALKASKEFEIMAQHLKRILFFLYDDVPGTQFLTSGCSTAICKLTSKNHKDDRKLEEALKIPTIDGRLGKTLNTTSTTKGFSFKEVIVFEAEINVTEKFSTNLANVNSNEFKAFANRVQPIIKGLYDSVAGEQDVEIAKCRMFIHIDLYLSRDGTSDTMFVVFYLISHGNNDEEGLRKVTERKIKTGCLSLNHEITDDGYTFKTNKCKFDVTVILAEKYSDLKDLVNPQSEAFKSFKEKVQPDVLSLYEQVCGSQEVDIVKYKAGSSGAGDSIILKLTSQECFDEIVLKKPFESQIQKGQLGSSLKACDLTFKKNTETVFYQITLNVKKEFTDGLKKNDSAEFRAFSNFFQTVLNTCYVNVPGKQQVNVVKCQQGTSGTDSTGAILEIKSQGRTDEAEVRKPIEDLINLGKLELTLKTNSIGFSFKIVKGSNPVSSKWFDLSLLITLLRKDSKVNSPKNGFDVLPPREEISDGAQLATIKHYRNDVAHAHDTNMTEHVFHDLWSNLEKAIKKLGKGDEKFVAAVNDALTMKLDNSSKEMLIKMVQHDKQFLCLDQEIEKLKTQEKEQYASTQAEINWEKQEIRKKEKQILKNRTEFQRLHNQLQRTEKKYDEEFRVQAERNVQQDEINKNIENRIQENRRDIKRLDSQRIHQKTTKKRTTSMASKVYKTKAMEEVMGMLRINAIVTVIGPHGSGKTTLINHVTVKMAEQEYELVPAKYVRDIYQLYNENTNQLFIFDDVCGDRDLQMSLLNDWNRSSDDIMLILEKKVKILVSSRSSVYKHPSFQKCSILRKSPYILPAFSDEEKRGLALFYMNQQEVDSLFADGHVHEIQHFSLCCHEYNRTKKSPENPQ